MNKPLIKLVAIPVLLLTLGISSSCKNSYWNEDNCLQCILENEIETNPKLKQRNIHALVNVNNGYAEIRLSNTSFPEPTLAAIKNGRSLSDVSLYVDKSVDVLIDAEETMKRVSKIKGITWTADLPGTFTSSTGSICTDFKRNCSDFTR